MTDVFGMIMRDASEGKLAKHKYIRDDGHIMEDDGTFYVADISEWDHAEKLAIREVEGPVLDIGCGAGRVGLYLQRIGISYTGIDISPLAIKASKQNGLVDVHVMSAADIHLDRDDFQTIIMFGNNFGIMGDEEKTIDMLKGFHKITNENARIFTGSRDVRATDVEQHLRYHQRNRERGRPVGQVTLKIEYKGQQTDWFDLLFSSPEDMNSIARKAGWYLDNTIGPAHLYIGVLRKA
ncbi:MAG: class I SAM-dependent methyltransferase [Candidatus Thorarchaeota archaeon]|jgi:SAM-dependent methyltransferase